MRRHDPVRGCVHLAAVGNASPFAQYMGFRLGRLGIRASYNLLPEYFMNHINLAGKDDIVIAISQSGSSKSVLQAMELAKKKGSEPSPLPHMPFRPSPASPTVCSCPGDQEAFRLREASFIPERNGRHRRGAVPLGTGAVERLQCQHAGDPAFGNKAMSEGHRRRRAAGRAVRPAALRVDNARKTSPRSKDRSTVACEEDLGAFRRIEPGKSVRDLKWVGVTEP